MSKRHLAGHPADALDPWCGTPGGLVTADWALVTCGRCRKEVERLRAEKRRKLLDERRTAQGTLIDPAHPALRPPNVVDFAEYVAKRPESKPRYQRRRRATGPQR